MARLRRLNLARRVVIVVALAGLLQLAGVYVITKGFGGPRGGWFGYAPNTLHVFAPETGRLGPAASWFVWLGLLVVWTVASLWLLGPAPEPPTDNQG